MVLSQPSFDKKRIPIKELFLKDRPDIKEVYLHHRLDFETSGVFLMTKDSSINKFITEMFQSHSFTKKYVCLTRPNSLQIGKKVEGSIIKEDPETWMIKNFMAPAKDMVKHKRRMISVRSGGWPAETEFKIIEKKSWCYFIEATPKTGRTHQIRQHLQESYRSILGDNIYGGKSSEVPRLMLHAKSLEFKHPVDHIVIKAEAALPADFESLLKDK